MTDAGASTVIGTTFPGLAKSLDTDAKDSLSESFWIEADTKSFAMESITAVVVTGLLNADDLPGAHVLSAIGRHGGGQGIKHTAEEHAQLSARSDSSHGADTQAVDGPLHHDGTDGRDGILQAHRKPDQHQPAHEYEVRLSVFRGKAENREAADHDQHASDTGNQLGDQRGHGGTGDIHVNVEDEHQVQHHIDQGCENQEIDRCFAVTERAENAAGHVVEHGDRDAHENDADIGDGRIDDFLRCVHKAEHPGACEAGDDGDDNGERRAQIDGGGDIFPHAGLIARTEGLGDGNGKAGARTLNKAKDEEVDRAGITDGGQLGGAEHLADNGGIDKTVELLKQKPEQQGRGKRQDQPQGTALGQVSGGCTRHRCILSVKQDCLCAVQARGEL